MSKRILITIVIAGLSTLALPQDASAGSNIGGGLHYLRNVGDFDESAGVDFDKNSFSLMGSYQYVTGIFKLEGDVEYIFDYAGSSEAMWVPQAYVLVGGMVYGGAGIGIGYFDGDFMDDPFYALRAGVDIPLGGMHLDVFGTYQFQEAGELEAAGWEDLNSSTLAALLRFDI